jgi:hypothetical protein
MIAPQTEISGTYCLVTMMENYALYFELSGLALIILGLLWTLIRVFRRRLGHRRLAPLGLLAVGLLITAFPPAYSLLVPIDLGPRETIVNGQRHITLTGWDRKDYSFLGSKRDVVVLQMANPDVMDLTLERLRGMEKLQELDLDNTQVTDAGLKTLSGLPALSTLHLRNTKITDRGFQDSLGTKESLMRLDVTGTALSRESVDAWLKGQKGRRALR